MGIFKTRLTSMYQSKHTCIHPEAPAYSMQGLFGILSSSASHAYPVDACPGT
jgi:hypothetical protein